MAGFMVYDPNSPQDLWETWLDVCGRREQDCGGNGFAFLDDDRNVIDLVLTDTVDDDWIEGPKPTGPRGGWDWVTGHAHDLGVTNVIGFHKHALAAGNGACGDVERWAYDLANVCEEAGLTQRGVLVGNVHGLNGLLLTRKVDAKDLNLDDTLGTAKNMREAFAHDPRLDDDERRKILAALDSIIASEMGLAPLDRDALIDASEAALHHVGNPDDILASAPPSLRAEIEARRKGAIVSDDDVLFDFPMLNVNDIKYLN